MKLCLNAYEYVKRIYNYELDSNAMQELNKYLSDFYTEDGEQAVVTEAMAADAYCGKWDTDSPLEKEYKENDMPYYSTLGDIVQEYLSDIVWSGKLIDEDVKDVYDTDYYVEEYN